MKVKAAKNERIGWRYVASSSSVGHRRRRPEPSPTQRALGLLTRREHSRQELTRKLQQRGVASADAAAVIDKLASAGWQNDARFAESLVRTVPIAAMGRPISAQSFPPWPQR